MSSQQQYKINLRLPCDFEEIGVFDCILDVSGTQIKCNRIILAKNSKWFEEYFEKNPKKGEQFTIDNAVVVPINNILPQYMQSFMNILYKNYLEINIENLPHLLKVAYFYKFPQITSILRTFYIDASRNNETLMYFAKLFIQNGLIDDAKALSEKIATHFIAAERKDTDAVFSIDDIYDALSPPVFAAVLIERFKKLQSMSNAQEPQKQESNKGKNDPYDINKSIEENLHKYTLIKEPIEDMLVAQYIEEFVKLKGIETLTEDDRESLADVFNYYVIGNQGLNDTTRPFMLKYDCDWFPARYARLHVDQILNKRRRVFKNFKKDMNRIKDKPSTNRWYTMSWITNVRDADTRPEPTPIIEFIRTLGASVNPINPIEYGLFNIESTKAIINQRKVENAFIHDPSLYFITAQPDNENTIPYIKFDLGSECLFKPSQFYFDSRTYFKPNQLKSKESKEHKKDSRGHVSKLNISYGPNKTSDTVTFGSPSNPTRCSLPDKLQSPFSSAKFECIQTDKESDIFRLTTIELFGSFE